MAGLPLQVTTLEPAGAFGAVAFLAGGEVEFEPAEEPPPPHPATSSAAAQTTATAESARNLTRRSYPSAVSFTAGRSAWGRFPQTGQSGSGTTSLRSTSIVRRS